MEKPVEAPARLVVPPACLFCVFSFLLARTDGKRGIQSHCRIPSCARKRTACIDRRRAQGNPLLAPVGPVALQQVVPVVEAMVQAREQARLEEAVVACLDEMLPATAAPFALSPTVDRTASLYSRGLGKYRNRARRRSSKRRADSLRCSCHRRCSHRCCRRVCRSQRPHNLSEARRNGLGNSRRGPHFQRAACSRQLGVDLEEEPPSAACRQHWDRSALTRLVQLALARHQAAVRLRFACTG